MFAARLKTVLAICAASLGGFASAEHSFSQLIASDSVHQYNQAADEARRGRTPIAMAILEGLVLAKPVRIAIVGRGVPSGCGDAYEEGVERGIEAWSQVLPDSPFRMVRSGEHADITVQFVPRIRGGGGDTQGIVNVRRHYTWNGSSHSYQIFGEIQIRGVAFGRRMTGREVERVMAHELGHVLGLGDDYDGPGVMSAFRENGGATLPSREEADAVSQFRGHVRAMLRRSDTD